MAMFCSPLLLLLLLLKVCRAVGGATGLNRLISSIEDDGKRGNSDVEFSGDFVFGFFENFEKEVLSSLLCDLYLVLRFGMEPFC